MKTYHYHIVCYNVKGGIRDEGFFTSESRWNELPDDEEIAELLHMNYDDLRGDALTVERIDYVSLDAQIENERQRLKRLLNEGRGC